MHFLDTILENLSTGVLLISAEGRFLAINPSAEALLKKEARTVLLQSFWDHFPDELFGFSMKEALKTPLNERPLQIFFQKQWIRITPHAYTDGPCNSGLLFFLEDMTQLYKLRQVKERASRLEELGTRHAALAHDLKNPLAGIRGYSMMLQQELEHTPWKSMAGEIAAGTLRLEELLHRTLAFVKPSPSNWKKTQMNALLQKSFALVSRDPRWKKSFLFEEHIPTEPIYAQTNPLLLERALCNIYLNGLQAMQPGGTLCLRLWQQASSCLITISDTGHGMSEKQQGEIFLPFFTTRSEGFGLGLAEVKKIVREHGGKIDVRSHVGKGTTFSVTLPLDGSL